MLHTVENEGRPLLPPIVYRLLPPWLLSRLIPLLPVETPEEIRFRCGRSASITMGGENLRLPLVLTEEEMRELFLSLCGGSCYAYEETLPEGYLSPGEGVRVGVCGRASVQGGKVAGVTDPDAIVIRMPHRGTVDTGELFGLLSSFDFHRGVLIYSPPGVGKTTLLRAMAARIATSSPAKRVAVVDTRGEFGSLCRCRGALVDVLTGYPRGVGIAVATRTLSAEVIVTDEVGDEGEAREILNAHHGGIPLIASAHGDDLKELLSRPGLRLLHEARVFGAYVGIRRNGCGGFFYRVTGRDTLSP